MVNIQNNFLGIINHHTSLKEALIIIENISIFYSIVYEPWEYKTLCKNRLLKRPKFLNFCPSLRFTSHKTIGILREKKLLKHMKSVWISILIDLVWIKHKFQEICIGSSWYFIDMSKGVIHIDQEFFLFRLSV